MNVDPYIPQCLPNTYMDDNYKKTCPCSENFKYIKNMCTKTINQQTITCINLDNMETLKNNPYLKFLNNYMNQDSNYPILTNTPNSKYLKNYLKNKPLNLSKTYSNCFKNLINYSISTYLNTYNNSPTT